jgi:hypothetical protein
MANQLAPVAARRQEASAALKSAEYNGTTSKIVPHNTAALTPQIYSQNRAKAQQIGTISSTMTNTFIMGNGALPVSNSMLAQNQGT